MKEYKLMKVVYSQKYRQAYECRYHLRHCVILKVASGRPKNVAVKFRGNEIAIIPWGNLKATGRVVRLKIGGAK